MAAGVKPTWLRGHPSLGFPQTITYDNVTEELHKYELAASHLTLNMPSTNSYIEYGSTIYYINSENQLCTYPTGLYVYDNDGTPALNTYENNHNGGTPVSITEGNIAGTYNIGIGNAKSTMLKYPPWALFL